MWFSSAARFRMVICRNENLIKHAAEVALNNLTARGRLSEWGGVSVGRGEEEEGVSSSTISTLFFQPHLVFLPSFLSVFHVLWPLSLFIFFPFLIQVLSYFLSFYLPVCCLPPLFPSFILIFFSFLFLYPSFIWFCCYLPHLSFFFSSVRLFFLIHFLDYPYFPPFFSPLPLHSCLFSLATILPLSHPSTLLAKSSLSSLCLSSIYDPAVCDVLVWTVYKRKHILIWKSLSLSHAFWEDN